MINNPLNPKDKWEDWSYNESESEENADADKDHIVLALKIKCLIIASIQQNWMIPIAKN